MIFKAKLEMFYIKTNFERLYPSNLLRPFCNVVYKVFSHIFNCKFVPVFPASVRGLTLGHLYNITDFAVAEMCRKVLGEV